MQREKLKKWMTRRKVLAVGAIFLFAGVLIGFKIYSSSAGDGIPVQTARVENKPLGESVFATGQVQLAEKQEIYAQSGKMVKELLVKPGDPVKKGQVMGYLEATGEENRLKESEAKLAMQVANYNKVMSPLPRDVEVQRANLNRSRIAYENARKKMERTEILFHEGAVPAEELESARQELAVAEADYAEAGASLEQLEKGAAGGELGVLEAQLEQARAGVEIARDELSKCVLTADRDGTVMTVEVEEGDFVPAGTRLVSVGNPERLEVKAGVSEIDSGRLENGQKVKITAAALPEMEFTGTVTEVARAAVSTKNNNEVKIEVPVKVSIDPGAQSLRPGYTVDLRIVTVPERATLVVPYEAVLDRGSQEQVFVVRENRVELRSIRTGLAGDLHKEVLEGLAEGDRVVLSPGESLTDGMEVREEDANKAAAKKVSP